LPDLSKTLEGLIPYTGESFWKSNTQRWWTTFNMWFVCMWKCVVKIFLFS
jgi:hypothetical protein